MHIPLALSEVGPLRELKVPKLVQNVLKRLRTSRSTWDNCQIYIALHIIITTIKQSRFFPREKQLSLIYKSCKAQGALRLFLNQADDVGAADENWKSPNVKNVMRKCRWFQAKISQPSNINKGNNKVIVSCEICM